MEERNRNSAVNQARRENPTLNHSGDPRDPSSPAVQAERNAGNPNAGNADYERGRADATRELTTGGVEGTPAVPQSQGTTEFRLGDITIAPGGDVDNVTLRHANVGTEKIVSVAAIASVLEDRFFTDKTEAAETL